MINKKSKIYVAGHNGLVGSAILRKLRSKKYFNLLFKTRKQLDLTNQLKVFNFLKNKTRCGDYSCGKSWWYSSNNTNKAEFIYDNLAIQKFNSWKL